MVSKATATKGSVEAIEYIMNDKHLGDAIELDRNMISGKNGTEILSEFREIQSLRPRTKNNTYSIVLSPDRNQKEFSIEELRELGREHLKNLGLDKNQYLMTLHQSTEKPHIHIQVNRISINGENHNDSFISKKAQTSAEKLANERGLMTSKEIQAINKQQTKELRKNIYKAYNQSAFQATSYKEFERNMFDKGYKIKLNTLKDGSINGFRIKSRLSGEDFKASEIHKNVRYNKLIDRIEENITEERKQQQQLEREQSRNRRFGPSL